MHLNKPKNDWAKALWILNATFDTGCSMATVLRDYEPFFYKFQARLSEVEKEFPKIALAKHTRTHESKITGKTKHYTHYQPKCSKRFLIALYNKVNENGFAGKTNKPEIDQIT